MTRQAEYDGRAEFAWHKEVLARICEQAPADIQLLGAMGYHLDEAQHMLKQVENMLIDGDFLSEESEVDIAIDYARGCCKDAREAVKNAGGAITDLGVVLKKQEKGFRQSVERWPKRER